MSVDVVIVAYNSEATIASAIESVIGEPVVDQVVVVDNRSPDRSADLAKALGASVIHSDVNSGFGAGCNLGAKGTGGPWILFLNPDASMDPGSLAGMLEYAADRPEVAVVASEVLGPSGRPQPVRRRFPAWWRAFAEPGLAARWDEWYYRRRAARPVGRSTGSAPRRPSCDGTPSKPSEASTRTTSSMPRRLTCAPGWTPPDSPSTGLRAVPVFTAPALRQASSPPRPARRSGPEGSHVISATMPTGPLLMRSSLLLGLWGAPAGPCWGNGTTTAKWRAAARVIRTKLNSSGAG